MKDLFAENIKKGDSISGVLFIVNQIKEKKTRDGKAYIDVTFFDKTGELAGKIWNDKISQCDTVADNTAVSVSGKIQEYGGKLQVIVDTLKKVDTYDTSDFVATSRYDNEEQYIKLKKIIKKIENRHIKDLLELMLIKDKECVQLFKKGYAAEFAHHNYEGGLIEHVLEILDFIDPLVKHYPEIDKDLLTAGVIFHDIGKIYELEAGLGVKRTRSGYLLGHIAQGTILVDSFIKQLPEFPEELRDKILHMILSHHGRLEYGSPVKPMFLEAIILHYLDNLSSKMNIMHGILKKNDSTDMVTDFNRLLDTRLYMGDSNDDDDSMTISTDDVSQNTKVDVPSPSKEDLARNLQIPF